MKTEELKKQIAAGKKRPMNLAYNPGSKGDDLLIIDRLKAPDVLGRTAKKEGVGPKVAFGSFVIDARTFRLTAEQELPGLAKKLRRYLKTLDYSYIIEVYDISGKIIEADNAEEGEDTPAPQQHSTGNGAPEQSTTEPVAPLTRAHITKRLQHLQPALTAFGLAAAPLRKAVAKVVTAVKAQELDRADAMLGQIETAIKKAGGGKKPSDLPNPKVLMARATSLKSVLPDLPPKAEGVIRQTLVQAVALLQARDFAAADAKLSLAERAVNAVARQTETAAAPTQAQSAPPEIPARASPQKVAWDSTLQSLEKQVAIAQKGGKGDAEAALAALNHAKTQAKAGKFEAALTAAAQAERLAQEPPLVPQGTGQKIEPVALSKGAIAALEKSRQRWAEARSGIKADITKLKMAIDGTARQIDGLESIPGKTSALLDHISGLDTALDKTLVALAKSQDAVARDTLLTQAEQIIASYRSTLDTEFFQAVDDNGFVATAIRGTALEALDHVETALAT